jgi:hypothetical protein
VKKACRLEEGGRVCVGRHNRLFLLHLGKRIFLPMDDRDISNEKAYQDKVLNLIKKLEEAHWQANRLIRNRKYKEAGNVLATCQKGAFSIGTTLEESEKDIGEVIAELEAYCDYLYEINGQLQNMEHDPERSFQVLDNRLNSIGDYISDRIKYTMKCFSAV